MRPRQRLASAFAWLRAAAVRAGPKDLLPILQHEAAKMNYLNSWLHVTSDSAVMRPAPVSDEPATSGAARESATSLEQRVFTALTWNVCSKPTGTGAFELELPQRPLLHGQVSTSSSALLPTYVGGDQIFWHCRSGRLKI